MATTIDRGTREVIMYCSNCGGGLNERDQFCAWCGTPRIQPPPTPITVAPPPVAYSPPTVEPTSAPAAKTASAPPRSRLRVLLPVGAVVVLLAAAVTITALVARGRHGKTPVQAAISSPLPTKTVTATPTPSASPTLSFATLYAREQSGVIRIETLSCDASGIGTGFLLSPTLVATVDHVIAESVVVSLIDGNQRTTGTVIGSDPIHDLALVRASQPLNGYHFHFASTPPAVGDQVGAIGFPIGDPITLTEGNISGLNRNITVEGSPRTGMIETDAAVNPGNSGGPLLTQDGAVVGLVDALNTQANGIAYAVPATQASIDDTQWEQSPAQLPPATCSNPLGPGQATSNIAPPAPGSITSTEAAGIVAAFDTYFNGINSGNYAAAYAVLSPNLQGPGGEAHFAAGDATSYDFGQTILSAQQTSPGTVQIGLSFTSLQAAAQGPNGETCDNWTLLYTMIQAADGSWLINATQPINGVDHTAC